MIPFKCKLFEKINHFSENMSDSYPSVRWERPLDQWNADDTTIKGQQRIRKLCQTLCLLLNEQLQKQQQQQQPPFFIRSIEYIHQQAKINSMEECHSNTDIPYTRYTYPSGMDRKYEFSCQ